MRHILLDTNSYSLYCAKDKASKKVVNRADRIWISVITVGELYGGFLRGSKFKENEQRLSGFIGDDKVSLVEISVVTAKIYGKIIVELYKKGYPIPTNDIWIAAQVVETGATLVTYDQHFLKVPNLKIWKELK